MAKFLVDEAVELLEAIYHYGGVNAAAEVLGRDPSGISRRIQRLSRRLGTPLLQKSGRHVYLTKAGEAILGAAPSLHAAEEKAQAELREALDPEAGMLTIAANSFAIATILTQALGTWKQLRPKSGWQVSEAEPAQAMLMMARHETDIAVMPVTQATPTSHSAQFSVTQIAEEPIDAIFPSDHPLATNEALDLVQLKDEQWIIGALWQGARGEILTQCHSAGFEPIESHFAQDWAAVSGLVATGEGISLVPRTAPPHPGVARVPLTGREPPSRLIVAVSRRGSEEHTLVKDALALMRRQAELIITGSSAT